MTWRIISNFNTVPYIRVLDFLSDRVMAWHESQSALTLSYIDQQCCILHACWCPFCRKQSLQAALTYYSRLFSMILGFELIFAAHASLWSSPSEQRRCMLQLTCIHALCFCFLVKLLAFLVFQGLIVSWVWQSRVAKPSIYTSINFWPASTI
jgi:hypothetical protein